MEIRNIIRRILNEEETEIGMKTKFEKTIANIVEKRLPEIIKDNNFYGVAVDVYNSDYGKICRITILLNKSFKMEDADKIQSSSREIKELIKSIVGNIFKGGISIGVSTLDSYNDTRWYYESKK